MSVMSDDEIEALVLENAKLKAALKASDYERGKLLELVENLICQSSPTLMNPANTQRQNSATGHQFETAPCDNGVSYNEDYYHGEEGAYADVNQGFYNHEETDEAADFEPLTFTFADLKEAAEELARQEDEEQKLAGTNKKSEGQFWDEEGEELEAYDPQAETETDVLEHKSMYGDAGYQRVIAAETTLQANFIKVSDSSSPVVWPCMPLNLNAQK